ncbi:hypothetical protein [Erythrobacter sp.]|uniref:hypothetical protein n=1 Tax=Erythrobacter sp. TaxID=1042 RepID=UPI001425FA7A|nr:hypothetical protein [Erythrobacter sp.]QIQ85688.1 MAG: hypothetical protein G9473_02545 [Erythrobacter sp.]
MSREETNGSRAKRMRAGTFAIALLLGTAAPPLIAAGPDLSALGDAKPLADEELADMRGKFVTPEAVSFFGITMLTSWQDASGVTTLARLLFSVDFLPRAGGGAPAPQLMIAWSRAGEGGGDPAMDVTDMHEGYVPYIPPQDAFGLGGLDTFSGAAQANVIAGADNRALNAMQVMIVPSSAVPSLSDGGLTAIDGPADFAFADGDTLHFRLADNQLGIVMTGNQGLDTSSQLAGGDIGQLLQQTILGSNNNLVENRASVIFGIDALQAQQAVRVQEALSAMKGHGF